MGRGQREFMWLAFGCEFLKGTEGKRTLRELMEREGKGRDDVVVKARELSPSSTTLR